MNTKIIGIIVAVTVVIFIAAVFFLSKQTDNTNQPTQQVVNKEALVRSDSFRKTSDLKKVTLVEFADFQCPACGAYHPLVKQLEEQLGADLEFVFRNFPLPMHKNAKLASYTAEAAGKQNKFWQMHDLLFENQKIWSDSTNAKELFLGYAQDLGLDKGKFESDLDLGEIKDKVERDIQDGRILSVNSTPTFFINDQKIINPQTLEDFKTLIEAAIINAPLNQSTEEKIHLHADFMVYLDGKAIDFTKEKYQSIEEKELDPDTHLHDGNGEIIHVHAKRITLERFLKSIGITFNKDCFILDTGQKYCSGTSKMLKMFINGVENDQFEKYEPGDLDRIMIIYGSESGQSLQNLINSVSDKACIYSEKCPERGKPPTEGCVGGLGSGCE